VPNTQPVAQNDNELRALLERTHQADVQTPYSALYQARAMYGDRAMKSTAHVVRAPRKLAITYLDGDSKGLKSGFNEHWFWRQDSQASPLEAYAEVALRPDEMTQQRFERLLKNYRASALAPQEVEQRKTDVVELSPLYPVEGATGPRKRLWIDEQTGLTLRTQTFNHQGRLVMTTELKQLDTTPQITATTFVPPADMVKAAQARPWMAAEMGSKREEVARATGLEPPQPKYVPAGFEFDNVGIHRCSDMGTPIVAAHSRYSDGLNALTVFAFKIKDGSPLATKKTESKATDEGAKSQETCTFGPATMAMRDIPGGRLVAVADLPTGVLIRVLDSTDFVPAKSKKTP
jgi:negative regulator of sigma E activity